MGQGRKVFASILATALWLWAGTPAPAADRPAELPPCGGVVVLEGAPRLLEPPPADGVGCDQEDGSVIDVLIVYTPVARAAAGGTAAIEAEIDEAVDLANESYLNSQIGLELNVVYLAEIAYQENGSYNQHLSRLRDDGDGFMDSVHALRNEHRADLVALIVNAGQYCGIAYLGPGPSTAFSVTTWYCAAGGLTLAHEIGHNQGCCHAEGDGGGCQNGGLYEYSNGHRFTGNSGILWRTVMAYSPGTRFTHFSNPNVIWDGEPTGVPAATPGSADNALTITQTSFTISNYRLGCHVPEACIDEDCNDNGLRDECDIESGTSVDTNANGIPDECEIGACCMGVSCAENTLVGCVVAGGVFEGVGSTCATGPCLPPCPEDVSGNGQVDFNDILTVIAAWGPCGDPCAEDLNGDGVVNFGDLLAIIGAWGPCLTPVACCFDTGVCLDTTEQDCVAQGGVAQATGSSCATVTCPVDVCAIAVGSCLEAHATPGCINPGCCAAVCDLDSFCCDVEWDDLCVQAAGQTCNLRACCLDGGWCAEVTEADCTAAGGTALAAGSTCATAICGEVCETATGSCYVAHPTPGCNDPACCTAVCDIDSFCCDFEWDQLCVDTAVANCLD
ncbi:MAG: M12 family metallo-peptidase [Planctomycetota bacterium]|jgi:hypothetical protein